MKNTNPTPDPLAHHDRFRQFVQLKSLRKRTIDSYLHWLRQIEIHYQTDTALDYDEGDVLDFLQYLREQRQLRPSTLNQAVVALRCFYRDMLGQPWDCWKQIKIKHDQKLPMVLTRNEVCRWLAAFREPRYAVFAAFVYHTGLRLNEARQVQIADLRRKPGHVFVREGKGGKQRFVPLGQPMLEQLRAFWTTHRNRTWLFPSAGVQWKRYYANLQEAMKASTTPLSESSIQSAFKLALAASGIEKNAHCHTLRHCYGTHLLEEGVSLRQVSAYLGHATLEQTVTYLHLTEVSEAKTQAALEQLHAEVIQSALQPSQQV